MTETSGPPRFLVRTPDGRERPVASVEALSRALLEGEVRPETPLWDGGAGTWAAAGDTKVVRFILEEMKADGVDLPPGWTVETAAPDPASVDFGLTLTDLPGEGVWSGGEPGAAMDPDRNVDPPPDIDLDSPPDTDVEPTTASGEFPAEPREDLPEEVGAVDEPPSGTHDWLVDGLPERAPWVPPGEEEGRSEGAGRVPDHPAAGGSRNLRTSEPRPGTIEATPGTPTGADARPTAGMPGWVLGVALLAAVLAGVGFYLFGVRGSGDPVPSLPASGPSVPGLPPTPVAPPVPEGLEPEVQLALDRFDQRIQAVADSLRASLGLDTGPPDAWLGGAYLASAGEYPEARAFWEAYRGFIEGLQALEPGILTDLVESYVHEIAPEPERAQALTDYLEFRYGGAEEWRTRRYGLLGAVADRAIELHDYLAAHQDALRHTPALGSAMPRDPVLEVAADDPGVRRELNAHLDAFLLALDRTRAGAPPDPGGLTRDLFRGFGAL